MRFWVRIVVLWCVWRNGEAGFFGLDKAGHGFADQIGDLTVASALEQREHAGVHFVGHACAKHGIEWLFGVQFAEFSRAVEK